MTEDSHHVDVGQKPTQHCKPITLQLKINIYAFFKRPKLPSGFQGKIFKDR